MSHALSNLFSPSAVAVYGASPTRNSMGTRALTHLAAGGFAGPIVPINPKHQQVHGFECYPSIGDYPGRIEHAMVAVPASAVPDVVRDCAKAGVSTISILSGGFAESGTHGAGLQTEVEATIREAGIRLLGPNCLGYANGRSKVCASPASIFEAFEVAEGPLAIVSQSGALAGDILARASSAGLGVSFWVSTGNELDLALADCLDYVVTETDARAIAIYLEGVRDANRLRQAFRLAADRGKTIAVLRAGRTGTGVSAVQSHTGALVTDNRLYEAMFREFAISQVANVRELVDVARVACLLGATPRRLALVTSSGGNGVLTSDAADAAGVNLAQIGEAAQQHLRSIVPFCSPSNPIDITGMTNDNPEVLVPFLSTVLDEPDVDVAVFVHGAAMLWLERGTWIGRILVDLVHKYGPDRLVFVGSLPAEVVGTLRDANVAVFDDGVDLIRAMSAVWTAGDYPQVAVHTSRATRAGTVAAMPEDEALNFLDLRAGVAVVARHDVRDRAELSAVAREAVFPLAVKAILPGVTHKTELGAVRLGIRTAADLEQAWDELATLARTVGAEPHLLVQQMIEHPVAELLVSAVLDPVLGPFVAVGAGGSLTEVLDDVVIAPAPVTEQTAGRMIDSLRVGPNVRRDRSGRSGNVDEVLACIVAVSAAIGLRVASEKNSCARTVTEIEINPFLVRESGSCAVDAVVVLADDV